MLTVGAAAAISAVSARPAVAAGSESEAWVALLAARHRRSRAALVDRIDEAERRRGPLAYEMRPEYRRRYEELTALKQNCTGALARPRRGNLRALVLKLHAAFH